MDNETQVDAAFLLTCYALQLPALIYQELVLSSLRDLGTLAQGIDASGMFTPNESLEDLATRHLPYLLVGYVAAEMEGRIRIMAREERMKTLGNSQVRCLNASSNDIMTSNVCYE